jgi:uncharacterized protein YdeI (YjbR/CyaY-like superfamily)
MAGAICGDGDRSDHARRANPADWRRWLAKHHASSPGIWLLRHKQHSGVDSMPYEDVVREALCFGWIDSLVKRVDETGYAIKVTPRRPDEQMVGHQPQAVEAARGRWPARRERPRVGAD